MLDREGENFQVVGFQNFSGHYLHENQFHRRLGAPQDDAEDEVPYPFQRGPSAVNLQILYGLPAGKGGNQSTQAQDVVQVTVGQQDAVQPFEPQPALENLPLGALTAIYQKPMVLIEHHLGREVPMDGRRRCRCA
jgi:hypothetical protein